jgi:hypothetical protein
MTWISDAHRKRKSRSSKKNQKRKNPKAVKRF